MKIRDVESEQEFPQLADMLAKAYEGDYFTYYNQFFRRIDEFPDRKLRNCRVLEVDGEVVAHVRVVPHVMHVGRARLRLGGIGAVGTDPFHGKKGYATALLHDTMDYMTREGYDVSLLFGITNFYPRFGYANCTPYFNCTLELAALPSAPSGLRVRKFRPADLPAVVKLHKQHAMSMVGAMERSEAYFRYERNRWGNYLLVTERGKAIGYVEVTGGPKPWVVEVALPERADAYALVLAECGKRARAGLTREVGVGLPPSHPFGQYCQSLGARFSVTYRRDGGAMGRLMNVDAWARKMCPEWSARLAASEFKDFTGALEIECDLGAVTLAISDGKVTIGDQSAKRKVKADQRVFAQFTFGYRTVEAARLAGELDASAANAKLLAALFPEQQAVVWPSDHF